MKITVLKFGGTSVGEPARARRVLAIVERAHQRGRAVVVVSALAGVTNALVHAASRAAAGEALGARCAAELRRRHARWLTRLAPATRGLDDPAGLEPVLAALAARLDALAARRTLDPHAHAWVLAAGERLAARVLAAALAARGLPAEAVDATQVLVANGEPLEADPDLATTRVRVEAWWPAAPAVPVVTGFLAGGPDGRTVLFGRGGSDLSATVLATALDAARVEIWTDTNGVLTADPRIEPGARRHARLDPATASALARLGARVLHPRTIEPLAQGRTELWVRDSVRPRSRGTHVARGMHPALASVTGGVPLVRVATDARIAPAALARALREQGVPAVAPAFAAAVFVPATALACTRAALGPTTRFTPGPQGAHLVALVARPSAAVEPGDLGWVLAESEVPPVLAPEAALPGVILAAVREADVPAALRALHEAFVRPRRPLVDVVLAGARGGVGRALLARLARETGADGPRLRLVAAFDTRGARVDARGLDPATVAHALERSGPASLREVLAQRGRGRGTPLAFVDCTASDELAAQHASLLAAGIAVVTANKRSLAAPLDTWHVLRTAARRAPLRASTTVGAGLPVLATVRALRRRGDALRSVRAALSGTLSFVLGAVHEGAPLSRAVALARARRLTEPHPAVDLSGADVARKLVIVLREAGHAIEPADVQVEPLVPAGCLALPDPESFLAALQAHDADFARLAAAAAASGRRIVYAASWDGAQARVGLTEVESSDPLAHVRPGENVVLLRTALHDEVPLVIAGPGAGVDVTAAGVHGDLLSAARALLAHRRRARRSAEARTRERAPGSRNGRGLAWA